MYASVCRVVVSCDVCVTPKKTKEVNTYWRVFFVVCVCSLWSVWRVSGCPI